MKPEFRHEVAAWLQGTVKDRAEFGVLTQLTRDSVHVLVLPQRGPRPTHGDQCRKLRQYQERLRLRYAVQELFDGDPPCLLVQRKGT